MMIFPTLDYDVIVFEDLLIDKTNLFIEIISRIIPDSAVPTIRDLCSDICELLYENVKGCTLQAILVHKKNDF